MASREHDPIRAAVIPSAGIFLAFATLYLAGAVWDHAHAMQTTRSLWQVLFDPEAAEGKDVLGTIGQAIPGVLGIAITVVAIVVELASNRYSSQVARLFIRDKVNLGVFGLFVIASVHPLWIGSSYGGQYVPTIGFRVSLLLASGSLLILLPYFGYVFSFLQPANIIAAIRQNVNRAIVAEAGRRPSSGAGEHARIRRIRESICTSIEQLADMALNSISQRDRALAVEVITAARGMVFDYFEQKQDLPGSWFAIHAEERVSNPDYVTLSDQGIEDLQAERVWLEHKVMKQLHLVFVQALNDLHDLSNLIAMLLKDVALEAIRRGDVHAHRVSLRFFNTALRSAFAARDVRTAYNILYQYRAVAARLIAERHDALVEAVFGYFKYYGLLFESSGLGFILETVAHDIYRLLQIALDANAANLDALLGVFLEVDRQPDAGSSDVHLRGVRKAQSMFAAYCLFRGRRDLAERIGFDMRREPRERMLSILQEIHHAERAFWEITDRGINFDYLEPELHLHLDVFFGSILKIEPVRMPPRAASDADQPAPSAPRVQVSSSSTP
jgi:hypothetical protein